jgi:transposase
MIAVRYSYIYPKGERAVRDLLRKRSQLVHQHTANLQSIENLLAHDLGHSQCQSDPASHG